MSRQARNERALNYTSVASLGRKAAGGGIIAITSGILRFSVQLGGTAILSRLLAPGDFGLLAMAATVTAFISLFGELGITAATIQRSTISQEVASTLFYINVAVGVVLALIAFAIAPVAAWFYEDARVAAVIMGLAIAIPLTSAGTQHAALLLRSMRMLALYGAILTGQLTALSTAILLILYTEVGYWALVAQAIINSLTSLVLFWWIMDWRPSLKFSLSKGRAELSFGLYLGGFNFLNYFHRQFDNVLIGWRYGSVELGYYHRAYSLLTMPVSMINTSISQVGVPALSRLKEDAPAWRRAFLQLLTASAIGGIGICTVIFVAAEPLVHLMLGDQWTPVIVLFRYLAVAAAFGTATNGCGWAFISLGKSRDFFNWGLFSSPLYVLSFAVGLPWGAQGVAIAYSIAMGVLAPVYMAYTARHADFRFLTAARLLYPILLIAAAIAMAADALLAELAIESLFWRLVAATVTAGVPYVLCVAACVFLLPRYEDVRKFATGFLQVRKIAIL